MFEEGEDLDLSGFVPKKSAKAEPQAEAIKAVSETANFKSREPAAPKPPTKADRRHRTGRNEQLNVKVDDRTFRLFYEIYDTHREKQGWVQGQVIEQALQALQESFMVLTSAKARNRPAPCQGIGEDS